MDVCDVRFAGPLRLDGDKKDKIRINPHSWHKVANMLFIDQPVGTGLAYTTAKNGYASSDDAISRQFHYFLLEFFKLYPNYLTTNDASGGQGKTRPVYFTGESHAGHYIPCMVSHITKKNTEPGVDIFVDIRGIALGNPWMDPSVQYDVSEFVHSFGLISHEQKNKLLEQSERCKQLLAAGRLNQRICFGLLDDVIAASTTGGAHKVLMYDIRKYVPNTEVFPPGHGDVETYLNREDVRAAIHAIKPSQHRYMECADPPYNALSHQDGKGVLPELQDVLNQNIRVLVFSGQYDIICNHVGVEKVLRKVEWQHRDGWLTAPTGIFLSNRQVAGYVKSHQNLMSLTGV